MRSLAQIDQKQKPAIIDLGNRIEVVSHRFRLALWQSSNPRRAESTLTPLTSIDSMQTVWLPFVGNYRTFLSSPSIEHLGLFSGAPVNLECGQV
jgi:hypothetical protein